MNENKRTNGPIVLNLTVDEQGLAQLADAVLRLVATLEMDLEDGKPSDGYDLPSVPQTPAPVQQASAATAPIMLAVQTPPIPQQISVPVVSYPAMEAMPAPGIVPTTAVSQEYTYDQLAVAAAGLVNQGKQARLIEILRSFGINAMTELPKEQYGAFALAIKAEGAVI